MPLAEIILRLGTATVIGGLIGLNRYAHHKAVGIRTLGLVALASAAIICALANGPDVAGVSRAAQGIITGIGFIGAGVIMRDDTKHRVQGLTTAATVWVSAVIGALCGLGDWWITGVAVLFMTALLILGGPLEKWLVRHKASDPDDQPES